MKALSYTLIIWLSGALLCSFGVMLFTVFYQGHSFISEMQLYVLGFNLIFSLPAGVVLFFINRYVFKLEVKTIRIKLIVQLASILLSIITVLIFNLIMFGQSFGIHPVLSVFWILAMVPAIWLGKIGVREK